MCNGAIAQLSKYENATVAQPFYQLLTTGILITNYWVTKSLHHVTLYTNFKLFFHCRMKRFDPRVQFVLVMLYLDIDESFVDNM